MVINCEDILIAVGEYIVQPQKTVQETHTHKSGSFKGIDTPDYNVIEGTVRLNP